MEFLLAEDGSLVNVAHIIRIHRTGHAELTNDQTVQLSEPDGEGCYMDINPCGGIDSTDTEIQRYLAESVTKAAEQVLPEICRQLGVIASALDNGRRS